MIRHDQGYSEDEAEFWEKLVGELSTSTKEKLDDVVRRYKEDLDVIRDVIVSQTRPNTCLLGPCPPVVCSSPLTCQ